MGRASSVATVSVVAKLALPQEMSVVAKFTLPFRGRASSAATLFVLTELKEERFAIL